MYLRCSNCHAPTWIRTLVPGAVERSVECGECGRTHDLANAEALGADKKAQYETANRFAEANGVDLPTAYSVLLGLMTLETARRADTEAREKTRRETAPPPAAVAAPAAAAPSPAPEGPRPAHAWAKKKNPPRARQRQEQKVTVHVEREMADARRRVTAGQAVLLGILATLVLGLTGRHAYRTWNGMVEAGRLAEKNTLASARAIESAEQKQDDAKREATEETVSPLMRTTVERDELGRLVRVSGTNPQAVLDSYCREVRDGSQRTPLGIADASPPDAAERFGVFRDLADLQTDHAIRIRRDRETRLWSAGDGRHPIATRPSDPDAVASSLRTP